MSSLHDPTLAYRFEASRVKLASVKKQIYNPVLPTIRRMERDEVLCRLPDEHCRHTTSLTEGEKSFCSQRSFDIIFVL